MTDLHDARLVLSLTSIPSRFAALGPVLESLLAQGVSIRDLAEQVCQEAGVHAATMSVLLLDAVFPPRPTRAPKPVSADEERIRALLAQEEAALLSGD